MASLPIVDRVGASDDDKTNGGSGTDRWRQGIFASRRAAARVAVVAREAMI
jgi:hypothetical protein